MEVTTTLNTIQEDIASVFYVSKSHFKSLHEDLANAIGCLPGSEEKYIKSKNLWEIVRFSLGCLKYIPLWACFRHYVLENPDS